MAMKEKSRGSITVHAGSSPICFIRSGKSGSRKSSGSVSRSRRIWRNAIIFLLFEDGIVFDGGTGTHSFSDYDRFFVVIMKRFDLDLLDRMAYGLDRTFPRFCPKFDIKLTKKKIQETLEFLKAGEP